MELPEPIFIDSVKLIDTQYKNLEITSEDTYYRNLTRPYFNMTKCDQDLDAIDTYLNRILQFYRQKFPQKNMKFKQIINPLTLKYKDTPSEQLVFTYLHDNKYYNGEEFFNKIIVNKNKSIKIYVDHEIYYIPSKCSFVSGDIRTLHSWWDCSNKFDVVIVDPPFSNKSVRRCGEYCSLDVEVLAELPLNVYCEDNSIILLWITNNLKIRNYLYHILLPRWGFQILWTHHWLKVTLNGDAAIPFGNRHRKSYEQLLVLSYSSKYIGVVQPKRNIPLERTLISYTPRNHSRKPVLSEFIKRYFPGRKKILEIFARSLNENWTSIGNDVIFYNHANFFSDLI